MALPTALLSLVTSKATAALAGLTLAASGVGVAGATDHLPERLQDRFDTIVGQTESPGGDHERGRTGAARQDRDDDRDVETGSVDDEGVGAAVSSAVHDALTGGADLAPGDAGFGRAVAENARRGGLGAAVSEAARDANGSRDRGGDGATRDEADDTAEPQGSADTGSEARDQHARGRQDGAAADRSDHGGRPDAAGRPADAGRSEHPGRPGDDG